MNKNKKGKKFGRKRDQRKALLKSLARALFLRERITTTEAKAKEIRRYVEPIITRAKSNTLANRRHIVKTFGNSEVTSKLFSDVGPRYQDRKGGYTRVIKRSPRKTDSAKMAVIEFV